jgi:hypothetical protein
LLSTAAAGPNACLLVVLRERDGKAWVVTSVKVRHGAGSAEADVGVRTRKRGAAEGWGMRGLSGHDTWVAAAAVERSEAEALSTRRCLPMAVSGCQTWRTDAPETEY